jgi:hypothetical protein
MTATEIKEQLADLDVEIQHTEEQITAAEQDGDNEEREELETYLAEIKAERAEVAAK